jgi:hypothetical protein
MIILEEKILPPHRSLQLSKAVLRMGEMKPMVGRAEPKEIAMVPKVATLVPAGREDMIVLDQAMALAGKEKLAATLE